MVQIKNLGQRGRNLSIKAIKKVSQQEVTLSIFTILLPAAAKVYNIYNVPEEMSDTVKHQIIGLNIGCVIALLLMFVVNFMDIRQNKVRKDIEKKHENFNPEVQFRIKEASFLLSIVNTILGIITAVMIFNNVNSSGNLTSLIISALTILLDFLTLYSVWTFYKTKVVPHRQRMSLNTTSNKPNTPSLTPSITNQQPAGMAGVKVASRLGKMAPAVSAVSTLARIA
jgi:uncharacterized membrane protein